jgi:hypothetical protein
VAEGYIYVGGYQPVEGGPLYIKAGRSQRPNQRMKDYAVMVPGGLNFMRSAKVDSPSRSERELLTAISQMEGVEAVGGEWFKCQPIMRLTILDELHRLGSEVSNVRIISPNRFGESKVGKRGKRRRG